MTIKRLLVAAAFVVGAMSTPAAAAERLCDPAFEDCRAPLLNLINNAHDAAKNAATTAERASSSRPSATRAWK